MLFRHVLCAILPALLAGCGGDKYVPVSGVVTLDGQPLAGAHVNFQPNVNNVAGSYGTTDAQGKFALAVLEPKANGAAVGTHTVRITGPSAKVANEGSKAEPVSTKESLHPRYNSATILTFEVPPDGTSHADFTLNSGK